MLRHAYEMTHFPVNTGQALSLSVAKINAFKAQ